MIISLEEAKLYLRIDSDDEDTLITSFILTAEDICEGILRFPLSTFETVPESVKQAMLYIVAQFYELRESVDFESLTEMVRRLLFAYRQESW
ncbi:MAG: head-tail connector protein [Bacillota bacterium]|nr:head-tail connector protein [Bacillota bacterium]